MKVTVKLKEFNQMDRYARNSSGSETGMTDDIKEMAGKEVEIYTPGEYNQYNGIFGNKTWWVNQQWIVEDRATILLKAKGVIK